MGGVRMNNKSIWDVRFLKLAKHISEWSKDPSTKVGAVITKNKRVVSLGFNGFAQNVQDLKERYDDRDWKYPAVLHAEVNAIMQVRHKIDLVGTKLWIARLTKPNNNNKIALAKPCNGCKEIIIRHGIKRVCYTIDASTFAIWKPPKIKILRKFIP